MDDVKPILGKLRTAYRQLRVVQQRWLKLDPSGADEILNQLEQRSASERACWTSEAQFERLPGLKERLLAKIDFHITHLCQEKLVGQLDVMETSLRQLALFYQQAGRLCQTSEGLPLFVDERLEYGDERRPPLSNLMTWLDETLLYLQEDLQKKRNLLREFQSASDAVKMKELRRSWRVPYIVQRRWHFINLYTDPFVQTVDDESDTKIL